MLALYQDCVCISLVFIRMFLAIGVWKLGVLLVNRRWVSLSHCRASTTDGVIGGALNNITLHGIYQEIKDECFDSSMRSAGIDHCPR